MKLESQVAILKTIVKWQAQEIEVLQDLVAAVTELTNIREGQLRDELAEVAQLQERVEALERGPEWQRIGNTGFSWDWQCRECQATMFAGHNTDCIHSEYVQPRGLVGGVVEQPNVLTGSIQGDTETITMTWPPKWEATAWEEVTFDSSQFEKAGHENGAGDEAI